MGWPDRLVPVPLDDSELEAVVKSVLVDPFGLTATLLSPPPEPAHLGATAWVFDRSRRNVLLVRHRTLGWSVPGGHLEPGESPAGCALRELAEETGLTGRLLRPEPCFVHSASVGGDRPHRHWSLAYAVEADIEAAIVVERDEVAWFSLDSFPVDGPADLAPGLAAVAELIEGR